MRAPRLRAERGRGRRNARGLPRGTPYAIAGMRRGWPSSQSAIARFSTFQMMPLTNADVIRAGHVEDRARHPAAERHADDRRHHHGADPRPGLAGGEGLAHDDGVARHDAALRQAEQRGDDVERDEAVERQVEGERQALQRRPQEQGAHPADPVGDPAGGQPADDAQAQHHGEHPGAVRDPVAEVARVGDDVDLRHRHGDAASEARDHQEHLQTPGRETRAGRPRPRRPPGPARARSASAVEA